jgi:hypothetical protein
MLQIHRKLKTERASLKTCCEINIDSDPMVRIIIGLRETGMVGA